LATEMRRRPEILYPESPTCPIDFQEAQPKGMM
jgi:hypothetical protein